MNNERTLSFQLSNKLSVADLADMSASMTSTVTYQSTLSPQTMDHEFDYIPDVA